MPKGTFLGEFELLVLLAVAQLDDAGYGVTIQEEIHRRTRRNPSLGSVYATLGRLEAKGYLGSRLGETSADRGGRAKRQYALRPAGVRALSATRAAIDQMARGLEWKPRPEGI